MKNVKELIEENRLNAFKQYVSNWKKQNPDTVELKDGIYSYKTKRGIVKTFQAIKREDVSKHHGTFSVNSFWFAET